MSLVDDSFEETDFLNFINKAHFYKSYIKQKSERITNYGNKVFTNIGNVF